MIGLCYLSIGGGMALGSLLNGRMLDAQYQAFRKKADAQRSEEAIPVDWHQEVSFPLEKVGVFCDIQLSKLQVSAIGSAQLDAVSGRDFSGRLCSLWMVSAKERPYCRPFNFAVLRSVRPMTLCELLTNLC